MADEMPDLWHEAQRKKEEQRLKELAFLAAMIGLWQVYLLQLQESYAVIIEKAQAAQAQGKPLNPDQIRQLEATRMFMAQAVIAANDAAQQWAQMIQQETQRSQQDGGSDAGAFVVTAMIAAGLLAVFGPGFQFPAGLGTGAGAGGLLTAEGLRDALLGPVGKIVESAVFAIAQGTAGGFSTAEITAATVAELQKLGEIAAVIGSDQAARAYREALMLAYQQISDRVPIVGYRRVSKRDRGVCPACIALDGKVYKLSEPFVEHPRGRCILVPILEGQQDDTWMRGTKWLASQPADVQRSVLGAKRYELWKDGKISLEDLARPDDSGGLSSTPIKDLV